MERRYGTFSLTRAFIENFPDSASLIMGRCVILRAETIFVEDSISYHAYSNDFDIVEKGGIVPKYHVFIDRSGETPSVEFRKH